MKEAYTENFFLAKNFHLQQGAPLLIMQAGEAITAT